MKGWICIATMLVFLILFPTFLQGRHIGKSRSRHGGGHHHAQILPPLSSRKEEQMKKPMNMMMYGNGDPHPHPHPLQIAGSSLPDCSHACGSCTPCRLVMVSFVCSSLEEAETCPMAYKCMCHNKSYPVP